MAGELTRFSYVQKDHAAIVDDVLSRIKEAYPDTWSDFYEDNAGRMLIEAFAYVADLLLFYIDRVANEVYLPTAKERQNIINICKLIGYNVAPGVPAQADLTFSLSAAHTADITIPKGVQVSTKSGVVFETQADATIPQGEVSVTVSAVEGETYTETIATSDGEPNQEYVLPRSAVIEIVSLTVDSNAWDAVESVVEYSSDSTVYMIEMDAWGRALISFGDGVAGMIPPKGQKITATYRIGGGTRGNVAASTITEMRDIIRDTNGNRVQVAVTNVNRASGGAEPESLNHVKIWAPRFFEMQDRCVNQRDYETAASTFYDANAGRIAKAKAVVREQTGEANIIRLYVLAFAEDGKTVTTASSGLKSALQTYLDDKKMLTDWVEIEDGTFTSVPISCDVKALPGFRADAVRQTVEDALTSLMDVEQRDMGQPLRISDIYKVIENARGVDYVELTSPQSTVQAANNEMLILGSLNIAVT